MKTRSGAQIRSHAQKYFLKIEKEYPGQDSYEIFMSHKTEDLEDRIYMKRKSADGHSASSPHESFQGSFSDNAEDPNELSSKLNNLRQEAMCGPILELQRENSAMDLSRFADRKRLHSNQESDENYKRPRLYSDTSNIKRQLSGSNGKERRG